MTQALFDPSQFLDQETDQVAERRNPLPAVDYNAVIKDVVAKAWESKDKLDEHGNLKSGLRFEIGLDLDLPANVQEMCNITKMTLTDSVMVDLNDSRTAIDWSKGKNNRLRQYRDATDTNRPGMNFSARMLIGKMVRVRVTHEEYQGALQERAGAISKAV